MRKLVPWKAVKILNTKNAPRFGARALPMLKAVNKIALSSCGQRRPYTMPMGPQNTGLNPMNSI